MRRLTFDGNFCEIAQCLDDVCSRSDIRQWIYEAVCAKCTYHLRGDDCTGGCFGCVVDKALRRIGG